MTKKYDQIIDDAIRKANEAAKGGKQANSPFRTSGLVSTYDRYEEYRSNDAVKAAVALSEEGAYKSTHIAVANALDIGRKALRAYIQEEAEPIHRDYEKTKELALTLDGSRSANNLEKRAVRFENLKSLAGMTSMPMKVKKAQAAPTKEEFNELVDAFRDLWARLFEIEIQRRTHGNSRD